MNNEREAMIEWSHMATSEGVQCPTIDSKNQPISPESGEDLKDAVECLENLAIGLLAEAKSTATKSLRAKQCEIRSKAMFTVLDALKSKEANDER